MNMCLCEFIFVDSILIVLNDYGHISITKQMKPQSWSQYKVILSVIVINIIIF